MIEGRFEENLYMAYRTYSEQTYIEPQVYHSLFLWQLLLSKSEYQSLVLNITNTDENHGGCVLLQNTDLNLMFQ